MRGLLILAIVMLLATPLMAGGDTLAETRSYGGSDGHVYRLDIYQSDTDSSYMRMVLTRVKSGQDAEDCTIVRYVSFGELQGYDGACDTDMGAIWTSINDTNYVSDVQVVESILDGSDHCFGATYNDHDCIQCSRDLMFAGTRAGLPNLGVAGQAGAAFGFSIGFANYVFCMGHGFSEDNERGYLTPDCRDDADNDGDGKADYDGSGALPPDPGCISMNDWNEADPGTTVSEECSDDWDNDQDGCDDDDDSGCFTPPFLESTGPCIGGI